MPEEDERPIPFDPVFRAAAARFATIRDALAAGSVDPFDRDAFLMARPVVELIRELRPEEGLGEAIDELATLIHHAYLFWGSGEPVARVGETAARSLLAGASAPRAPDEQTAGAYYVQYPSRRIWGEPLPSGPHEPLDGCFVVRYREIVAATAVFGFHPDRAGFSVVQVAGRRPSALAREDGSSLFAPVLPGGAAAGLHSLTGMEELLELVWRTDDLVGRQVRPAMVTEID